MIPTASTLIGNTPLLGLSRFGSTLPFQLYAKLESRNLTGSDKDRLVQGILEDGAARGLLTAESVIVEATSGSLALSLAVLGVQHGYRVVLVMPEGIALGRVRLLRALGAEVVLSAATLGMRGAQRRAETIVNETPNAFRLAPYTNPAAVRAHHATADEIWRDTGGDLAAVIVPVATGAMITGIGQRLKELNSDVQIIAVQPAASPVLTGGSAGAHRLLGMGAPFIPENFDPALPDRIVDISDNECHDTLIRLYRTEGLTPGPAGGAALAAALRLAAQPTWAGGRVVVIFPDSMERYAEIRFWETFTFVMPTLDA